MYVAAVHTIYVDTMLQLLEFCVTFCLKPTFYGRYCIGLYCTVVHNVIYTTTSVVMHRYLMYIVPSWLFYSVTLIVCRNLHRLLWVVYFVSVESSTVHCKVSIRGSGKLLLLMLLNIPCCLVMLCFIGYRYYIAYYTVFQKTSPKTWLNIIQFQ